VLVKSRKFKKQKSQYSDPLEAVVLDRNLNVQTYTVQFQKNMDPKVLHVNGEQETVSVEQVTSITIDLEETRPKAIHCKYSS